MIKINDNYHLAPTLASDRETFVKYLNDPEIYRNTLRVPKPYTLADADHFVELCAEKKEKFGREMEFRIRLSATGESIGGISLHGMYGADSHRDEIGYALYAPYRNKGIMTAALKTFCAYVFENHPLTRLEATIFNFNNVSAKLLERVGFNLEGKMKNYYVKDGNYIDALLYAYLKK